MICARLPRARLVPTSNLLGADEGTRALVRFQDPAKFEFTVCARNSIGID